MTEQKLVVLFVARLSCLKAQVILINVFLVQYLSGNLSQSETRCSKCLLCTFSHFHMWHNLSHTCGESRLDGPFDHDDRCALVRSPRPAKASSFQDAYGESWCILVHPCQDCTDHFLRLLHLAWFWRVDSSYRAAPTQPLAKSCIGLDG